MKKNETIKAFFSKVNMNWVFMSNRFKEIKNIMRHRKVLQRIAKEKGYSFPFHDFVKMINVFIFGDKIATKLHRKFSKHHDHKYFYSVLRKNATSLVWHM